MAIQRRVHPGGFHHLKSLLRIGCWNVRSLMEVDGNVRTANVRSASLAVDKKICFLVHELKHFRMGITYMC